MSFPFSFVEMVEWLENEKDNPEYFENDQQMVAFVIVPSKKYEQLSQKQVKKRGLKPLQDKRQGYLGAFVKRHIPIHDIRRIRFEHANSNSYPLGMYYMKENEENVYFVYPTLKSSSRTNQSMIFANHFSFSYDKITKQVSLHNTEYISTSADITIGQISHYPSCLFKDSTSLPMAGYETKVFEDMLVYKDEILDLCRSHKVLSGGGKVLPVRKGKLKRYAKEQDIPVQLEQTLIAQRIKKIVAIGYKVDDMWHVICNTYRTEHKEDDMEVSLKIKHPTMTAFLRGLQNALNAITQN
jgi:hypothetical protein